jgi:hypothetical protein
MLRELKPSKTVDLEDEWVVSTLCVAFPSDPPLCAEDRETDAKCKCLPMAAELLATCGTEKGGNS